MSKTLVLVTNASTARVFSYQAHEEFSLLKEFSHPESRQKGIDLVSDRPGHSNGKGGGHGAFVPPRNPKQVEVERFAHELASWLDDERRQNRCDQVMLVADPGFLGVLNKSLNNQTTQLVFKSLNKDYSQVVQRDLPEMLGLAGPKKNPYF
ncbi:MAG: protein required for attachment to host cells [Psychromonas sp.]|jgi:protein required for attachment to host cells|uniref:host attachment protein n=1 Tax=Psychromonas sp. TaxID=1884585 RepID=UPI0039E4753D